MKRLRWSLLAAPFLATPVPAQATDVWGTGHLNLRAGPAPTIPCRDFRYAMQAPFP